MIKAIHLKKEEMVKFGAYYTPPRYIKIVWELIKPYLDEDTVVFDPACGYGFFLEEDIGCRKIGNDIDKYAIFVAKRKLKDVSFFSINILKRYGREIFGIKDTDKLVIVGNPPYNDVTSQAKKKIKKPDFEIDENIRSRDIGISFLRMFTFLKPEYICILHPLSYLVKKANFQALREFKDSYRLIDGVIFSSKEFGRTSKLSEFPILIGLYQKYDEGMDFGYIQNFLFKTVEGYRFKISDFDYIGNYIQKYPKKFKSEECELYFYTLRDINALKRNKTFLDKPNQNAICVDISKLDFYIYVDIFKDFVNSVPYYLGNLDIIIDIDLFNKKKQYFLSYAVNKRPFLSKYYKDLMIVENYEEQVIEYFDIIFKRRQG